MMLVVAHAGHVPNRSLASRVDAGILRSVTPADEFHVAAAQGPTTKQHWRERPEGPRTLVEAVSFARSAGIIIEDDVTFVNGDAILRPEEFASYASFKSNVAYRWEDLLLRDKIVVKVRSEVLVSDDAIVCVFAHEMHEVNALREMFAARESIPGAELITLTKANQPGNLHDQAWKVCDDAVRAPAEQVMNIDQLIRDHRSVLTETELFAALTQQLSTAPSELDRVRELLSDDMLLATSFEDWLEDLKFHPLILFGDRIVRPSETLLARLGPVSAPPHAPTISAAVQFGSDVPYGKVIGAQASLPGESGLTEWSVAITVIARVESGSGADADTRALLSFVGKDAPYDRAVQQVRVPLTRDGIEFAVATPRRPVLSTTSPPSPRQFDDGFLPDLKVAS